MVGQLGRATLTAGAFAAMLALAPLPVSASHDPDVDDDELKCQINAGKVVAKFSRDKLKCLIKCADAAAKGDPVDCKDSAAPPAGDGDPRDPTTQACVDAAEAKAIAGYNKKCSAATCPDCSEYSSGNCSADGPEKVATAEGLIDVNDALLAHCNDSGSGDGLNADELDCQNARSKNGGKLVADLAKCSAKCLSKAHKGDTTRQCDPNGTLDPESQACVDAVVGKCAAKTDAKCTDTPECNTNGGQSLCNTVFGIVSSQYGEYYCGS